MSISPGRLTGTGLAAAAVCLALAAGTPPTATAAAPSAPPSKAAAASIFAVTDLDITETLELMKSGRLTSAQLTASYLARIEAYNDAYGNQPGLKAISIINDDALATAKRLDAERRAGKLRGPLHGVPIIVKDNYATADMPTTAGNASLATYQTKTDSTAVARLRAAGAIILAKTNMSEFAWSGQHSLSSTVGRAHNPFDQSVSTSGSSGGTGGGVAAALGAGGLGTDSCGSILGPSAHQSLVGYRPTQGLTSVAGIVPLSLRQDVSGPMVKSVRDAALVLEVLAGRDPADPQTDIADAQVTDQYVEGLSTTALAGKRVGRFDWDWAEIARVEANDPGLVEAIGLVDAAIDELEAQGATVVDVPLTYEEFEKTFVSGGWMDTRANLDDFFATTDAAWPADLAANTAPADKLTFSDIVADGKVSATLDAKTLKDILDQADLPNDEYEKAGAAWRAGRAAMDALFTDQDLDALAVPSTLLPAADLAENHLCGLGANTGIPTMTIPAGLTTSGLPVGLELAAPRHGDAALLAMGYDYEQATGLHATPTTTPELGGALPVPDAPASAKAKVRVPDRTVRADARGRFSLTVTCVRAVERCEAKVRLRLPKTSWSPNKSVTVRPDAAKKVRFTVPATARRMLDNGKTVKLKATVKGKNGIKAPQPFTVKVRPR